MPGSLHAGVGGSLQPHGLWGLTEELRLKQDHRVSRRSDGRAAVSQDRWTSHSNSRPHLATCKVEILLEPSSEL